MLEMFYHRRSKNSYAVLLLDRETDTSLVVVCFN